MHFDKICIGRESNPGRPRAASMKLAGEHSTTEPPMPLTIARLDGLLDCNLKHPGYLTKEDSKAREKKSPPFKTEDNQKNSFYLVEKCSPMRGIEPRPRR